jgi:hypothetical protein
MKETPEQFLLRATKQALFACQEAENTARKNLALAVESTKAVRAKYDALFHAAEMKAYNETKGK